MTTAVLAVPTAPPPDPTAHPGWDRMRSIVTDRFGVEWDLTNPEQGLFLRREGVRGLGHTKPRHFRDRLNTSPGVRYRGTTYDERDVFWPLHMFHDGSSAEYVARDEAFFAGLNPRYVVTWTVEVPGISRRHLDVRLDDDGDWAPESDPTFYGWTNYGLRLTGEDSFWRGEPIVRKFRQAEPSPFFSTSGGVLRISRGATLANATITNPGDEPGWVVWRLDGPFTSAKVAVAGKEIEIPFSVPAGKHLIVDARPRARTAVDSDGNDRYAELGQRAWGQVPPGTNVPLDLVVVGEGAVTATLVPQYHRAWGTR